MESAASSSSSKAPVSAGALAEQERARQRALLRDQKNQRQLTTDEVYQLEKYSELKVSDNQDTGGGFFVDSDNKASSSSTYLDRNHFEEDKRPILPDTRDRTCSECNDNYSNSFLLSTFGEEICDQCKDLKGKHCLMTRTEAKNEYLLTDVDLDRREPPLRCWLRKNPREYARGCMKLYLRMQIEERALEVWGSEEKLEEEREIREGKRESRKRKQFNKQMKQLRMATQSSYYEKRLNRGHEHEFGPEEPFDNPEDPDGEYFRQICSICGLEKKFEKM